MNPLDPTEPFLILKALAAAQAPAGHADAIALSQALRFADPSDCAWLMTPAIRAGWAESNGPEIAGEIRWTITDKGRMALAGEFTPEECDAILTIGGDAEYFDDIRVVEPLRHRGIARGMAPLRDDGSRCYGLTIDGLDALKDIDARQNTSPAPR